VIKGWQKGKSLMENYLLRIYRIEKDNPRNLVGLVEKIGDKKRLGFASLDELWEILNSSAVINSPSQSLIRKNEIHPLTRRAKPIKGVKEKKVQK
jgi:hypothetical protein